MNIELVKVRKETLEFLEKLRKDYTDLEIVKAYFYNQKNRTGNYKFKGYSDSEFLHILLGYYELEKPKEELVKEQFIKWDDCNENNRMVGMVTTLNLLGIEIEGVNK